VFFFFLPDGSTHFIKNHPKTRLTTSETIDRYHTSQQEQIDEKRKIEERKRQAVRLEDRVDSEDRSFFFRMFLVRFR